MKFQILLVAILCVHSLFFIKVVYADNTELSDIVYDNAQESIDNFVEGTKEDILSVYYSRYESFKDTINEKINFYFSQKNLVNSFNSILKEYYDNTVEKLTIKNDK